MRRNIFEQDILEKNGLFFFGLFLFVFIGSGFLEFYGKEQLHLLLNQYYSPFFDKFFSVLTDYSIITMGAAVLYICTKYLNFKTLFYIVTAFTTNTLVTIFIKRVYFVDGHRPIHYFQERGIPIHLVEGVNSAITYTFPSGHSANAFLFMLFFCMLTNKVYLKVVYFFIAFLVAYSRVYLSKHFLIDTMAGALLGVTINLIVYYIFKKIHVAELDRKILP